ncbi:clavesin-1 [Bombyx mori]|uniref:CRAL-TRIO domain-containing protein n=1 Tax=Bombyx mori TaxID=7091 RepID=A0A8R1WM71_BOMMO|nr:clavesin-1 [Bombyx mori]
MPFIDIAFQAELSRYEDPEFEEYAKKNCNEFPDTRHKVIEELRRMVRERGECIPRRVDDAYCLRFLRCRRFIPALAHKLMVRYEDFRQKNAYLYNCDPFGLQRVKNVYGGTLPESPENGRIVLMRFGRWDPSAVPIEDVVRCALFMDEIAVMQPKLQILGVTIIVDLDGLSIRHVRHLTPTVAYQIVSLMGVSFPLAMHGLHIINYNWILNSVFYLFKQFIPAAVWSRLHFHGSNMESLHKFIQPQYLPPEYGGSCRHIISTEEWIAKIYRYKDDFLIEELRDLGFYVT